MSTSMYENWDSVSDWWNADFINDWVREERPPGSGTYVMVRGTGGSDWLIPGGVEISGDFTLDWDVALPGSAPTGNTSVRMEIYQGGGGSEMFRLMWHYGGAPLEITWRHSSADQDKAQATWSSYGIVKFRLQRVGSTTTAYYDIGSGWVALANPFTSWSGDFYINMDGADQVALGNLDFTADGGFPYPFRLFHSQYPGQLTGQFPNQL